MIDHEEELRDALASVLNLTEHLDEANARIRELEGALRQAREFALDGVGAGDFDGWLDAVNDLLATDGDREGTAMNQTTRQAGTATHRRADHD